MGERRGEAKEENKTEQEALRRKTAKTETAEDLLKLQDQCVPITAEYEFLLTFIFYR